jgi:pimeloyl-ACP methyl ester carboxylesterase
MDDASTIDFHRRTFEVESRGQRLAMAGLEFGDPARPVDVIFLHANGFNALTYRHALAPLGDRLHILAIDQRGHGRTPQGVSPEPRNDWFDMRDDLLGLLDVLALPAPVVLAGHSMGGCVSLMAAAAAPERVSALALFDPVILSPGARPAAGSEVAEPNLASRARTRRREFPSFAAAYDTYSQRSAFATWPPEVLKDYVADGFIPRPDGQVELACTPEWEASNFIAHGHDIWGEMTKVRAPLTILRAENGSTCSLAQAGDFPGASPSVRIETIPGSSHFLPMERPDLVRATLLEVAGR